MITDRFNNNSVKMVHEFEVVETKNNYTTNVNGLYGKLKKPVIKKILWGVEIKKPTAYRIYERYNSEGFLSATFRIWVFGDIEIYPNKHNVKTIAK